MNLAFYQHPIDRAHQENWQHLKTLPFRWRHWLAAADDTPANQMPFANQVERLAKERLQAFGLATEPTGHSDPFDLWAIRGDSRAIRVEVKGSQAYYYAAIRAWRYQAAIRNRQCDILLFICLADFDRPHFFVIPQTALERRRNLTISSLDPRDYGGQWSAYLEAWHYLHTAFSQAGARAIQPALI